MNITRRSFFNRTASLAIGGTALAITSMVRDTPARKLLHVAVGDANWEPTLEELQTVAMQVQMADLDPKGGLLVTRNGIQITRV